MAPRNSASPGHVDADVVHSDSQETVVVISLSRNRRGALALESRRGKFPQEDAMSSLVDRLPSRFPVGTRYVIEGRGGGEGRLRIHLRYLEFPDGRQVELPSDSAERMRSRRSRQRRRTPTRK
jgi:hypothetical protein